MWVWSHTQIWLLRHPLWLSSPRWFWLLMLMLVHLCKGQQKIYKCVIKMKMKAEFEDVVWVTEFHEWIPQRSHHVELEFTSRRGHGHFLTRGHNGITPMISRAILCFEKVCTQYTNTHLLLHYICKGKGSWQYRRIRLGPIYYCLLSAHAPHSSSFWSHQCICKVLHVNNAIARTKMAAHRQIDW